MNTEIIKICDRADLDGIKRIHARNLPIKHMIIYLESKLEEYDYILSMDVSSEIQYMKSKTLECILYLKKVQ